MNTQPTLFDFPKEELAVEIRRMTFGKYKDYPVIQVIAEHIGYIMWCFENIPHFRLNHVEQTFYDWIAIAIVKQKAPMTFPIEPMLKHVRDREALKKRETPYIFDSYFNPYISETVWIAPYLIKAGVVYSNGMLTENESCSSFADVDSTGSCAGLAMLSKYMDREKAVGVGHRDEMTDYDMEEAEKVIGDASSMSAFLY